MELDPATLPPIDEIELVPLDGKPRPPVSRFHRKRVHTGSVTVSGGAALEIADLWRALPQPAAVAMCHDPPFALRFFHGDSFILEASLCWACNNAYGFTKAKEGFSFLFDGRAEVSRRLLARLDELCPGRKLE